MKNKFIKKIKEYFKNIFNLQYNEYCDGFNCSTCKKLEEDPFEIELNKNNINKYNINNRFHYWGVPYSKCKFKNH